MKVTVITKDLTDTFYSAWDAAENKWQWITAAVEKSPYGIEIKIGNGSFRDRVELNQITRTKTYNACRREARRGYMLTTFQF